MARRIGVLERLAVLVVQETWGRQLARHALDLQLRALGQPPARWFESKAKLLRRIEIAKRGW